MKAYILIQFNLINRELFGSYIKAASSTIPAFGGQVIVAQENPEATEGSLNTTRTTIIEFPSKDAAMNWYNSNDYADVKHLRHEATDNGTLIFLEAWQRPQH